MSLLGRVYYSGVQVSLTKEKRMIGGARPVGVEYTISRQNPLYKTAD